MIKEIHPFLNHELNHLLKINSEESSILLFKKHENSIKELIKGNFNFCITHFKKEMKIMSENLKYEEAQLVKEKILSLKKFQAKSTIVNPKITNVDVFSIVSDENYGYVNFLQVSYGAIVRSYTLEIRKKLQESNSTLLQLGIIEIRQSFPVMQKLYYFLKKLA